MADEQIIVEINYDTDQAQKNVSDLTDEIVELENANKDLREQVKRLLDEPELLHHLRSEARLLRSGNQEAEEVCALYQRLLAAKGSSQPANKTGR